MTDNILPKAIAEHKIQLLGVMLRCYVLDNGMRVFDKDDVAKFFNAMGDKDNTEFKQEQLRALSTFVRGIDPTEKTP